MLLPDLSVAVKAVVGPDEDGLEVVENDHELDAVDLGARGEDPVVGVDGDLALHDLVGGEVAVAVVEEADAGADEDDVGMLGRVWKWFEFETDSKSSNPIDSACFAPYLI